MALNSRRYSKDQPNFKDPIVRALDVIVKGFDVQIRQAARARAIQELFQETFIVTDPKGTRKLNSQRLYQALWRTAGRTKPLDFIIQGTDKDGIPVDPNQERLVTAGTSTVMTKGGYNSAFRDKQGLAFNFLLYGDAFLQIGTNDDKKSDVPIKFHVVSPDNIYVDNFATAMRSTASGASATKLVIIYTYSKESFDEMFPGNEETEGAIQRNNADRELIKDTEQWMKVENKVEVAYSYDLTTKTYVVFAGTDSTELECYEGDDYPFWLNGEAYIPVLQFIGMPSAEGFYNEGIGSMVWKLAVISRELLNMEVNHLQDNTYPIVHMNIPKGEVAEYFNKLKGAYQMRDEGKKGFVAMGYDPNSPNSQRVTAETLLTQNLFNEWDAIFNRLDQEIRRLGINIDELEAGGDKTATEILALEENSNAFVKQVMEYNASESQLAVDITMNMIKEFVAKTNKTPLNLDTKIALDSGKIVRISRVTLGMIAEELKTNNYWAQINARSGAIPSNNMQRAKINAMLPLMQPGSLAWKKAVTALAQIDGFDAEADEFLMQAQTPQLGTEPVQGQPSGTDRLTINSRVKEQLPVIA